MGNCTRKYAPLKPDDEEDKLKVDEAPPGAPVQWPSFGKGAGQFEFQGYETWTPAEQQAFKDGKLTRKWAVGQVSIRLPLAGPVSFVAIVYGYLPFIIPLWWAEWVIWSWVHNGEPRFFPLCGLSIAAGFALVNETVTKQICKRTLPPEITSRPPEAVCKHPGMPSGHVMNAYTLMIWCFLEALLDKIVHPEWLIAIVLVMGPVPWARVYNKDHTVAQVMVSAVVAVFMGGLAYYIRKTYFPGHYQPWDSYNLGNGLKQDE